MPTLIHPGEEIDGYTVEGCLHAGGNGYVYRVRAPADPQSGFPLVMKVPGIGPGEPTLGVVSFEIEQNILALLTGPHVPRVVASGDLSERPYLVMEEIAGESLATIVERAPLPAEEVARIGAALADAVYSVHRQQVIHFDLKPENFILRPGGEAVLLDFGFARHANYPDLLAEEATFAAGSAAYVSPEQLNSDRSDARSDIFALGAILYELATGEPPFGEPQTYAGMRDRLWRLPAPPRSLRPDVPPWLQEIILNCLERHPARRYASAAHVAFDLRHPQQVALTKRAALTKSAGFGRQLRNWWTSITHSRLAMRAAAPPPAGSAPVIMVAVDTEHLEDERHPALQRAVRGILAHNPDYRLMVVSAIGAAPLGEGERLEDTASGKHLQHRNRLGRWVQPLGLKPSHVSLHVIESGDTAATLLEMARLHHVDLIVLGAPGASQRALAWWRSAASTVAANASCSVHLVRVPERVTAEPLS